MNCSKCSSVVSPSQDAVSCVGCSRHFHAICEFSGSSTEVRGVLAILRLRENIIFLCSCCRQWIIHSNFSGLVEKLDGLSVAPDMSKIEEDIATNRNLIKSLSSKINEMSTIISSPSSGHLTKRSAKSTVNRDLGMSEVPPPVETFGTSVDSDLVAVEIQEMRQLYVGRLDPSTTAEQVVQFICKKVEQCKPSDLVCRSLVKKDRPSEQSLTFISFKIAIPAKFFSEASDLTIWPQKVLVREFVQQQQKNYQARLSSFPTV